MQLKIHHKKKATGNRERGNRQQFWTIFESNNFPIDKITAPTHRTAGGKESGQFWKSSAIFTANCSTHSDKISGNN